jgi:hypothetical protein
MGPSRSFPSFLGLDSLNTGYSYDLSAKRKAHQSQSQILWISTMATYQGRHRHSFATTTLLALFVFGRYQLGIDAFQPHCHSVAISKSTAARRVTRYSDVFSLPIITSSRPVPPISAQRRVPALKQQADDDSSAIQESDAGSFDNTNTSKSQLSKAYTIGQYLFLSTAVLHLCTVRPSGLFLESEFARSTEWGAAAGFGVAAGISYILKGALESDRLNSDTYKRLSVGLLGFCLLGLAAVPGEAAFVALPGSAAVIFTGLVRVYGTALSFVGWKRGVVGAGSGSDYTKNSQGVPRIMLQEFTTGLVETVKGLRVKNAKKALAYRNCLLIVVAAMFSNFMEGIFDLRVSTLSEVLFFFFFLVEWTD